jgi:hypothetical protein
MDADDVKFVVPSASANSTAHYLYLHDGRVIRINPATGKVLRVAMIPSDTNIKDFAQRLPRRRKSQ